MRKFATKIVSRQISVNRYFGILCVLFGVLCVMFGVLGVLFGILGVLFGVLSILVGVLSFCLVYLVLGPLQLWTGGGLQKNRSGLPD